MTEQKKPNPYLVLFLGFFTIGLIICFLTRLAMLALGIARPFNFSTLFIIYGAVAATFGVFVCAVRYLALRNRPFIDADNSKI
ncbi:MAG: hypothetical protein WAP51_01520 [Candidatus Sungiibacteriota bacterium]